LGSVADDQKKVIIFTQQEHMQKQQEHQQHPESIPQHQHHSLKQNQQGHVTTSGNLMPITADPNELSGGRDSNATTIRAAAAAAVHQLAPGEKLAPSEAEPSVLHLNKPAAATDELQQMDPIVGSVTGASTSRCMPQKKSVLCRALEAELQVG
jgi:hypothetical protein